MPLMLAPLWTRNLTVGVCVGVWFAVNPVMTPKPSHHRAFATRAMLGEEMWAADRGRERVLIGLNIAGSAALGTSMVAAWRQRAVPAAVGVAATMVTTMLSWQRYASIFDRYEH